VLAYATTVHKAQGSEYPAVVLVAQPKAVAIVVKGQQERRRWSKLREWLS
jgi:exodeoxyribonuclease V alpha subunit